MATTGNGPETKYETERRRIKSAVDDDKLSATDRDRILEFLDALDPNHYNQQAPGIETKTYSTLEAYGQNLRLTAAAVDKPLTELTAREVNDIYSDMADSLSQNTVQQRQAAARVFYRYHADLGVDPDAIYITKNEPTPVDPRDLFSRDEIDAMREATDNARDRAIIDLMLYTGQRIRAIQTLRVQDVEIADGKFYLNPDAFGLKGAKGMRPLLVAKGAVSEWMDYHPAPDDPDAYFITKLPDSARGNVHEPLYQSTINRAIKRVAEEAGIERWEDRAHAHNLRHTFVRWAYVNRDMDLATIKWMMGHAKDSRTLEETYFNILDKDHATKAMEAAGVQTPDEDEDITPPACPVCEYALPSRAKACPRCGTVLTPDAASAQDDIQEEIRAAKQNADTLEEYRDADQIAQDLTDNPEFAAELMEKIGEISEE